MKNIISENIFPTVTKKMTVKTNVYNHDENGCALSRAMLLDWIERYIKSNDIILVSKDTYISQSDDFRHPYYSMSFEYKTYDTSKSDNILSYCTKGYLRDISYVLSKYYSYCDIVDYKIFYVDKEVNEEPLYQITILYKTRMTNDTKNLNEIEVWI